MWWVPVTGEEESMAHGYTNVRKGSRKGEMAQLLPLPLWWRNPSIWGMLKGLRTASIYKAETNLMGFLSSDIICFAESLTCWFWLQARSLYGLKYHCHSQNWEGCTGWMNLKWVKNWLKQWALRVAISGWKCDRCQSLEAFLRVVQCIHKQLGKVE